MGIISPSTFNPLDRFVATRLQQGVPIVDADWNEAEDIRKFELRAYLKWFVGNGIPEGNDGFRIEGTGLNNDFFIRAGLSGGPLDALTNVGRCLVEGLDVMINADLKFTDQPLHEDKGAAADTESARLGVPKIQKLIAPAMAGNVTVYLDVWERLVSPAEDPTLILPGLGVESCARLKREWVVRVRGGNTIPISSDADFIAGHNYYALATLTRRAQGVDPNGTVNSDDVTERRQIHLSLTSMEQRIKKLEVRVLIPAFVLPPNQLTPNFGAVGSPLAIKGRNFDVGNLKVEFVAANNALTQATFVGTPTATDITVSVPNVALANYKIKVTTDGGSVISDETFTVQ